MKLRYTVMDTLGIKQPEEFGQVVEDKWMLDEWYEYFVNEWLPEQGEADMILFIEAGFDTYVYFAFKLKRIGNIDDKKLIDVLLKGMRFKPEHVEEMKLMSHELGKG